MTQPKETTHICTHLELSDHRRFEKWTKIPWKVTSYNVQTWDGTMWVFYTEFHKYDTTLKGLRKPIKK